MIKFLYMEPKKYINFKDYYSNADSFAEIINKKFLNIENARKIIFARELFTKDLLNSYFIAGFLSVDVKGLLGSNTNILKFSMDNMIKNQLAHPEVTYEDYQKIPLIIKSPSKYFKSKNGYDVILFKEDESFYKLVIKTIKNRKENFVKSLHLLNKDRYNKY